MQQIALQQDAVWQNKLMTAGRVFLLLTALCVPTTITGTEIGISIAALLCWISGDIKAKWQVVSRNPLVIMAVVVVLFALLGTLWSSAPWPRRMIAVSKWAKLLYIPLIMPLFMHKQWRQWCLHAFVFAIFVTVVMSYMKAFGWLVYGKDISPGWVFHSHVETSFFVAFAAFIVATRAWQSKDYRWLNITLFALFTIQEIFVNDGRTGYFAYFLLALLFLYQRTSPRKFSLSVLSVMVLLGVLYVVPTKFSFNMKRAVASVQTYHQGVGNTSAGHRIDFARFSGRLIKEKPLLGHGSGSFLFEFLKSGGLPNWGPVLSTPHSDFLMMATELGIIGLLVLLYFYFRQWRMLPYLRDNRRLAQGLLLSFVAASLINSFLYTVVMGYFYVFMSALLFSAYEADKTDAAIQTDSKK